MDLTLFRAEFAGKVREARLISAKMQEATAMSDGSVSDSREKLSAARALLNDPALGDPAINHRERAQSLLAKAKLAGERAGSVQDQAMKHMWADIAESCRELAEMLLTPEKDG